MRERNCSKSVLHRNEAAREDVSLTVHGVHADKETYMKIGNKERRGSRGLNWDKVKGKWKRGRKQTEIRNRSEMDKEL